MDVLMSGMSNVRQRMLVVMIIVGGVGVALMNVVGVTIALHARVAALGTVHVLMLSMHIVIGGRHSSSLL
jgi:hypothetical protein